MTHFVSKKGAPKGRVVVSSKGQLVDAISQVWIAKASSIGASDQMAFVRKPMKEVGHIADNVPSLGKPELSKEVEDGEIVIGIADRTGTSKHEAVGIRSR